MPKSYPENPMKNLDISILKDRFQVIALTPPGLPDPAIAIAASRAGGIGILDLEFNADVNASIRNINEMARFSRNICGIKLNGEDGSFISDLTPEFPENLGVVILTHCEPEKLRSYVKEFHQKDRLVFLEVTSLEQAISGQDSGVDGFIGKGSEAGGFTGEKTSFVLLQQLCDGLSLPVWIHGGIGLHTSAASYAAGASGIVLDSQLFLTKESPLPEHVRKLITVIDSRRTICIGNGSETCRIYGHAGFPVVNELMEIEKSLNLKEKHKACLLLREEIKKRIDWGEAKDSVWLLGQDAAFAGPLAKRYGTVGSIIQAVRNSIDEHLRTAKSMNILNEKSPMALSHGTLYPIVQGPMARVSDKAAFAASVAEGGSLPFIALSMLDRSSIDKMLEDVAAQLGNRPWGVGILGFNKSGLLKSQMEAVETYSPQFAIIAGGMPKQVKTLESKGIKTYAHVQTAGIMKMFIDNGARRFIFEGRECGGHIGPISSFVLWEEMIGSLLETLKSSEEPEKFHVLFAGGIHNARSAAMVAAMAAPLAKLGVLVGVVMGTAYLFTEEAGESGTIVSRYQQNALECTETYVLRSGPGHSIRCCKTPLVKNFENEKRRLESENLEHGQISSALEKMFVGRLNIASKGTTRSSEDRKTEILLSEKEQHKEGIYMIGQLAALRDRTCTVQDLHHDVSVNSSKILSAVSLLKPDMRPVKNDDVAIIGMSCLFPKANNLLEYWENILNKVNAISEIPVDRWDWQKYFDDDPKAKDKIYSKWGGFLEDIHFDPLKYGMPPNSLKSIEPLHLMTLEVVRAALKDAGYEDKEFNREATSVIMGTGEGIGDVGQGYVFRSLLPMYFKDPPEAVMAQLPEWTEDSFPGMIRTSERCQ
jgi:NAD(P)H-dependent flavin oxidoreductase YrpB (nitropropane dioxygenase family)